MTDIGEDWRPSETAQQTPPLTNRTIAVTIPSAICTPVLPSHGWLSFSASNAARQTIDRRATRARDRQRRHVDLWCMVGNRIGVKCGWSFNSWSPGSVIINPNLTIYSLLSFQPAEEGFSFFWWLQNNMLLQTSRRENIARGSKSDELNLSYDTQRNYLATA